VTRARTTALLLGLLLAPPGCGDDDATPTDAGPGDAGPSPDGAPPDAGGAVDGGPEDNRFAALPATPDLGGCPEGWREVDREGIAVCDPWPASGIAECTADDEAHFVGAPGCERVGTACPSGEFADDLPASDVLHVREGAPSGGDGSRADPFGTIADALAAASPGTTIALSAGRFVQPQIDLPEGVTLWGACVAETVLVSGSESTDFGVVSVRAPDTGLRNLRIEGRRPGIDVGPGGGLTVRDVVVAGAEVWGVRVHEGGALDGTRLVVRDTNEFIGSDLGEGLYVLGGATVDLSEAVFERNHEEGVYADGTGTSVTLTDVAIRDTGPSSGRVAARGVGAWATSGATLRLERAALDRNQEAAAAAVLDSRLEVERAAIRDVAQSEGLTDYGAGLLSRAGSTVDARRVWIERATHVAVIAIESGTSVVLRDALVRDTRFAERPMPDIYGMGIAAEAASLEVERTAVVANGFVGVLVQEGAEAELDDLIVRDTRSRPVAGEYGRGLEVQRGGRLTVRRGLFEGNRSAAVSARDAESVLDLADLTIRDTHGRDSDGRFGYGVQIGLGATLTVTRADVTGSRGVGVVAFGSGSRITATETRIADTRVLDCVVSGCPSDDFGYAAASYTGALVSLTTFELTGAVDAGLQLADGGEADLSDGLVADSPVGFNVQTAGFDESRLRDGVTFRDVGAELDRSSLPTSDPLEVPPIGI